MRILHVDAARTWGGGQNQVRLLMRGLAERGIEQLCVCPARGALAGRLAAEGLPVKPVHWERGFDTRALARLVLTAGGWDLLHAHDAHSLQLGLLASLVVGTPVVAARRVRFRTRPFKWNRAERVIAVSEAVREHTVNAGVDERRVVTIHSGIDLGELVGLPAPAPGLRELLGIPADVFLAGTIGTLLEYKHQERIVEAALHAGRDIAWVIIGDGPRREALEAMIRERRLESRVLLAGQLPDARRYIREMDAFVFPSLGEALGTSVLDAMALGVTVVAADDAGPAEVLAPVHARTGSTLVPPEDAYAFARAVDRFREDGALRRTAVEAQLDRVQDFSIDHTVAATLHLYAEVLDG